MLLKDVCGNESFALIQGVFVTSQGDALFTKVIDVKEDFNVEVPACPGSGPSLVTVPPEPELTTILTSPGITSSSTVPTEPSVSTTQATTTPFPGVEEDNNNFIIFLAVTVVVMLIILLLLCCLCWKMRSDDDEKPLDKSFDSGSISEPSSPEKTKDSKDRVTPTPAHPPFPKKQDSFSPSPIFSPPEQKPSQSHKLTPTPCNSTPDSKKELQRDKETNKWCFVDVYED